MYTKKFLFYLLAALALPLNLNAMEDYPADFDESPTSNGASVPISPLNPQDHKTCAELHVASQPQPTPAFTPVLHNLVVQPSSQPQAIQIEEVHLDPENFKEAVRRKAENWWRGTDDSVLKFLRALQPRQVIADTPSNQGIILSAVNNFTTRKANDPQNLSNIEEFLSYVNHTKGNKPVCVLCPTGIKSLTDFLVTQQITRFITLHEHVREHMKPMQLIAKLQEQCALMLGEKPSNDVQLNSLSKVNLKALEKIMLDMAASTKPIEQKASIKPMIAAHRGDKSTNASNK